MRVTVVVIGVGEWDRYTKPLLDSIKATNPDFEVVLVDNGSQYPGCPDIRVARTREVTSYPEAINIGLDFCKKSDWYIVTNNDVLFHKTLDLDIPANTMYGFWEYETGGETWLSGWCLIIPRKILLEVGNFDRNFKPMYYEDADYSLRVVEVGFHLSCENREDWGIEHLNRNSERAQLKEVHSAQMEKNLQYLKEKHGL